jgi:putative serine protease PepD
MNGFHQPSNHPTFSTGTSNSAEPPRQRPPERHRRSLILSIILAVALSGVGGGIVGAAVNGGAAPVLVEQARADRTVPGRPVIASTTIDAQSVGAAVVPSIVTVEVGSGSGDTFRKAGSGSGVVLDRNGNVVTNNHVVEAGPTLRVVLSDGRVYEANLVGTDPVTDLAVVRVPTADLQPITFGSTDGLAVGTPVVAVGSPLGLEGGPSLSLGVVSALGREVQTGPDTTLYGMIQTDAPITSGSSGGSLVDAQGNLLGITTAVGVSNIGVEGIGFATPIEVVDRVVEEIITSGTATHAMLGIRGSTDYDETGDGGFEPMGVAVASVAADSPAQAAGIAEGDVITAVDGTTVRTMDELISVLRTVSAGDTVMVSIAGSGPVSVVLADR